MTNEFTPRAKKVMALARQEARRLRHDFIRTEHLLCGLIELGQGVAITVLRKLGIDLEGLRVEVERQSEKERPPNETGTDLIPYTSSVKTALALAAKEAAALQNTCIGTIGTEHLLLGLLIEDESIAARVLKSLWVNTSIVRDLIFRELDPNCSSASAVTTGQQPQSQKPQSEVVNTSKRYDIYCMEGDVQIAYRNVLFNGVTTLLKKGESDIFSDFLELEQTDGKTIFIARCSLIKFWEHRETHASNVPSELIAGGLNKSDSTGLAHPSQMPHGGHH